MTEEEKKSFLKKVQEVSSMGWHLTNLLARRSKRGEAWSIFSF